VGADCVMGCYRCPVAIAMSVSLDDSVKTSAAQPRAGAVVAAANKRAGPQRGSLAGQGFFRQIR
jgi:hypothetical protein